MLHYHERLKVSGLWGSGGNPSHGNTENQSCGGRPARGLVGSKALGSHCKCLMGSNWSWEHHWRKAAHSNKWTLVTKELFHGSWWVSPRKGRVVDTLHQPWLSVTSLTSGLNFTSISMVFSKIPNLNLALPPPPFFFMLDSCTKFIHH